MVINLEDIDIDIDALEKQPEMAFGSEETRRSQSLHVVAPEEEIIGESKRQRAQHVDGARRCGRSSP